MYGRGMGTGWVWLGGIPGGVLPSHTARGEVQQTGEAGPGRPCRGLEWWSAGARANRRRGRASGPPCGPGRVPCTLPVQIPSECRLLAYMARFNLILLKVSQNNEVSPKSVHKASHSPYIQNGLQKSPLGFLRFPFLAAFSPKELMGRF